MSRLGEIVLTPITSKRVRGRHRLAPVCWHDVRASYGGWPGEDVCWSAGIGGWEIIMEDGLTDELGHVPCTKPLHQIVPMHFHGLHADLEHLRDLSTRIAVRHEPQ